MKNKPLKDRASKTIRKNDQVAWKSKATAFHGFYWRFGFVVEIMKGRVKVRPYANSINSSRRVTTVRNLQNIVVVQ